MNVMHRLIHSQFRWLISLAVSDGVKIAVRSCAVSSFDNVCGVFRLGDDEYDGCLMSCTDDACNASPNMQLQNSVVSALAMWTLFVVMCQRIY